jgi:hypothetical protein
VKLLALVVAMALVPLGLMAGPAFACTDPGISVSSSVVHPGDSVTYNIAPVGAGATITVRVNDVVVDGPFPAEAGSVTRSFRMPDMGSVNRVSIETTIEHGDIDNPEQTITPSVPGGVGYAGNAPDAQPAAPEPTSTGDQSPAPAEVGPSATVGAPTQAAQQQPVSVTSPPPSAGPAQRHGAQPSPRGGGGRTGAAHPSPAARHRAVGPRHQERVASIVARGVETPNVAVPIPADKPVPVARNHSHSPSVVNHTMRAKEERQNRALASVVGARPRPPRAVASSPARSAQLSPVLPLGLAAAVLIAATLWMRRRGFGVLARRRPTGSVEPPRASLDLRELEIEAELQEILSEEHARRERTMTNAP